MLTLDQLYQVEKEQEQVLLSNRAKAKEDSLLSFLCSKNRVFGAYATSKSDFAAARHYFYQCGRLDSMRVRKYNNRLFDYGLNNVCMMLLSDSISLANDYAQLRYLKAPNAEFSMDEMVAQGASPIWPHSLFMIIQNNRDQLAQNIDRIRSQKAYGGMEFDLQFLQGMYDGDATAVEKTLQDMARPEIHQSRIDPPDPAGETIFFAAAGYAKLARMKGINIEINSTAIPEELIRIAPLPEYRDAYDFVDEYLQGT